MKKSTISIVMLFILVLSSTNSNGIDINGIEAKPLQKVINQVNEEYRNKYGFPDDFYNGIYPISQEIYDKYNILVCSIDGVDEHGARDSNGEYRYIGYDPYGENIENPNYYYDALDGRNFNEFQWLKDPWFNKAIIDKYNINRSHFDHFAPQFRDIFLYGFNYYHGTNGIFGNHLGTNWRNLPWETYYHIPIAPTETTRGVAWLFHKEEDGSIWYTSAWLPPLSVLEQKEPTLVEVNSEVDGAVIGHNKIGASIYNVKQSVPTSEQLYVNITTSEYLMKLSVYQFSGTFSHSELIHNGFDTNGNPIYIPKVYDIPYRYYKIDHLEVYGLDHTVTYNYALPNGSVTIYPDSEHYQMPTLQFNTLGGMDKDEKGMITAWNDELIINGQVILDSSVCIRYAPEPNDVVVPMTQEKALYKDELLISPTLPNKTSSTSQTIAYYTYIGGTQGEGTKSKNITTNSVTVHTPVVCDGGILSDNDFDQSMEVDASRASVILGRPTKIQLLTKGQHKNIAGYGNKDYIKYTSAKQIKIPFDVYIDTTTPEKNKFLKANTWYNIPADKEVMDLFVPTWVNEGNYTIDYRSLAINSENKFASEKIANLNINNYVATDTSSVKVIGRLYGFRITDIEDYPLWENVFRTGKNSLTHSNNYYPVGIKDKDGIPQGNGTTFTLPLLKGSHPTVKNEGAIPLGYTFKFECETIGNYSGEKDCIEIHPTFYYISKDGKVKQEVDLWYSEFFNNKNNYFIKVGSEKDEENVKYIKIGDPDRNVPSEDIKDTSKILGLSEKVFMNQNAKLGWFYRIVLAKPLRTFNGNTDDVPQGVVTANIKKSVQHWYGEYYLPNMLYVAPKGTDVLTYSKANNGLNGDESFWLKDGYIVVNFDIVTIKNADFNNPILSYHTAPRCNMWQVEGYNIIKTDYNGVTFNLKDGDVVFYDINRHVSDDYGPKGTH